MKSLEECVVNAMDGTDQRLFPFLPYLLQDVWEIGADPIAISHLFKKHCQNTSQASVLDLGCGKGAISVQLSRDWGCRCHGIDAIPEFIRCAREKAIEWDVDQKCYFVTGDIRHIVNQLPPYDVVILGAIGPVFGDLYTTLETLSHCIRKNGIFILDDGYIEDDSDFEHPMMYKKSLLLQQIENAGMQLLESVVMDKELIRVSNEYIFKHIRIRGLELIEKFPDQKNLILDYLKIQETENDVLENKVIGTTMVIGRK